MKKKLQCQFSSWLPSYKTKTTFFMMVCVMLTVWCCLNY